MHIDPTATLALISELYAGMNALRDQLNAVTAERDELLAAASTSDEKAPDCDGSGG